MASKVKTIALLRSNPKDAAFAKIVSALSKSHKVSCLIWDRQHDYTPIIVNENITYVRCGLKAAFYRLSTFLKLFLFDFWLFAKLLYVGVDCIHAIDLDTGFIGLCVAKLRSKKFVYQCLDPYYTILPKGWPGFLARIAKRIENVVISQADLFIITDLLRMPQHQGARPKQLLEIANVPYADLDQSRSAEMDGFVVGYIGSLAEGRGLTTIMEAVGELCGHGVRLIIGGFGPLDGVLREGARRYDNVSYVSWVPFEELFRLEKRFDVFVYLTDKDNAAHRWVSPYKLFESMAFGKPIIVGVGTLAAQRVLEIGNGLVIPYGSKEELKKAILMLKANRVLSEEMGEKGKLEFERRWRPQLMEQRLLEAYATLGE